MEEFNVLVKSQVFVELTADELVRMLKEPKLNLERGQELPVVIKWFQVNFYLKNFSPFKMVI